MALPFSQLSGLKEVSLFTNHLEDELISARGVDKSGKVSLRDLRAAKSGGKVGQTKL